MKQRKKCGTSHGEWLPQASMVASERNRSKYCWQSMLTNTPSTHLSVSIFLCLPHHFVLIKLLRSAMFSFSRQFEHKNLTQKGDATSVIMPKVVLLPIDWSEFAEKAFDCEYSTPGWLGNKHLEKLGICPFVVVPHIITLLEICWGPTHWASPSLMNRVTELPNYQQELFAFSASHARM